MVGLPDANQELLGGIESGKVMFDAFRQWFGQSLLFHAEWNRRKQS